MILWVWDRFKNLSFYHYRMIIVTIFVPVILTVAVTYFAVDCLVVRVILDVGVVLVWALFAVVVVALMVERDMAEAHRLVSQQTGPFVEQVHRLEEEHGDLIADVRLQVEDLESRTRSTFERLGVDLPPKPKPRWDVHWPGVVTGAGGSAGDLRILFAGWSGSTA